MDDEEPGPEPQQKQQILTEINKNVVESPLKQVKNKILFDEQPLIKLVEQTKNKKLSDEEQKLNKIKKVFERIL